MINKDHEKRNLLCLLMYILKFALERQVNIESNKVQSCDFQFRDTRVFNPLYFQDFSSKLTKLYRMVNKGAFARALFLCQIWLVREKICRLN